MHLHMGAAASKSILYEPMTISSQEIGAERTS
jgi:hypothetical protein